MSRIPEERILAETVFVLQGNTVAELLLGATVDGKPSRKLAWVMSPWRENSTPFFSLGYDVVVGREHQDMLISRARAQVMRAFKEHYGIH